MPARMDSREDGLDAQIAAALRRAGTPSANRRAVARRAVLAAARAQGGQPAPAVALRAHGLPALARALGAQCAAWFLNDCAYERARTATLTRTTHTRLAYAEFMCSL